LRWKLIKGALKSVVVSIATHISPI